MTCLFTAQRAESNDDKNYRKKFQVTDGIVENDADVGTVSEPDALKSNWMVNSVDNNQIATNFAQRQINRFSAVPREVSLTIDQKYIGNVAGGYMGLGSIFAISTNKIVDGGLNPVTTACQCVQIKPSSKDGLWDIKGLSYKAAAPPNADFFIDS